MGRRRSRSSRSDSELEPEPQKSDVSHIISARHNGRVSRSTLPRPLLTLPPRRPAPLPPQTLLGRVGKVLGVVGIVQVQQQSAVAAALSRIDTSTALSFRQSSSAHCWQRPLCNDRSDNLVDAQNDSGSLKRSIKRGSWFNPETLANQKVLPCVPTAWQCASA